MAVPVITAFASVGPQGEWGTFALSSALFHIPVLLAAAIAAAYAIGRPSQVARYLMAGLLISIVIDVVVAIAMLMLDGHVPLARMAARYQWVPSAWLAGALATFICRSADRAYRRAIVVGACAILVALPLGGIYRERSLWYPHYSADDDMEPSGAFGAAAEDVIYKQPSLLSQELRAVRPASEGRTNVYFVGMAGYGSQDVFRREVDSVAKLFRERFDADGHVIRLVNNRQTLLDIPIASKTSLRASLKRVAEVMDKDRDVLVLYMTSHGSEDHRFALSLLPLRFHEIDPAILRQVLDESGIRNRVVIISACYSGGFVKPLEDPNTLVITASAPDRNSFGCSNEAEWTYFGKAYFDEALRTTHSFTKAFEMAKPRIAQREREEKFDPSMPQMAIGRNIAGKLQELEQQLDGGMVRAAHVTVVDHPGAAHDRFDDYVSMMFSAEFLDDMKTACASNMDASGPAQTLAREPGAFSGLERSRSHWKRLEAAWDGYAAEVCAKGLDAGTVRGIYEAKIRALMSEKDLDAAMEFLRTPAGTRWIRLEREASRQEAVELARKQGDINDSLYKRYLEERARIFADFRKNAS